MRTFTHPYNLNEPLREDTHCLIIGTAPPPRFFLPRSQGGERKGWDVDFYYGSKESHLWDFLDDIAYEIEGDSFLIPEDFNPEGWGQAMRSFLRRHKIWMRDVLQTHQRQTGSRAGDDDIVPPSDADFFDFQAVFKAKNSISTLAFTSHLAATWTLSAFAKQDLLTTPDCEDAFKKWQSLKVEGALPFNHYIARKFKQPFARAQMSGRELEFYVLPSPSAQANELTLFRKRDVYKSVLFPR